MWVVQFFPFLNLLYMVIVVKGRRPNFMDAARPEEANILYELFNDELRKRGIHTRNRTIRCNDGRAIHE